MDNLLAADMEARRNKKKNGVYPYGIRVFDKNNTDNRLLKELQQQLLNETFQNQPYRVELRKTDHKWRELYKVNYYPTHILHHAVMRVLCPYLTARMSTHCYSGIEGRGLTQAADAVKLYLKDREGTKFYLQEDIKKFYPTIDQDVALRMLERIFKDKKLIRLLDKLLHHTPQGLQIGFYISQLMANYMYTLVDRVVTEKMGIKYYVRFCDDMVVMHHDKYYLLQVHREIKNTVENVFHQQLHDNYVLSRIGSEVKNEKNTRKRKRGNRPKHRLPGIPVQSRPGAAAQKH